ncbi:hypothetical protein QFC24_006409 [Naganishia onofrii]|uniref:Uncharacterized protein n=1 Tax=Naganishia onofrii TaxID=1851511 RepID=A0ACC2X285_9TREE|nr:hypothetical protein QFC24_006409 [Naganishia onofrii]
MEHLRKAESRGNSLYRSVRQPPPGPGKDTPQPASTTLPSSTGNTHTHSHTHTNMNMSSTVLNPSTPKDAQNQSRIIQEYTKLEHLQEEKIVLADTLRRIVTRHRERARDEWRRIVGDEAVAAWEALQEEELAEGVGKGKELSLAAIAYQVARMPVVGAAGAEKAEKGAGAGLGAGSVGGLIAQLVQKGGLAGSGWSTPSGADDRMSKSEESPSASASVFVLGGGGQLC